MLMHKQLHFGRKTERCNDIIMMLSFWLALDVGYHHADMEYVEYNLQNDNIGEEFFPYFIHFLLGNSFSDLSKIEAL